MIYKWLWKKNSIWIARKSVCGAQKQWVFACPHIRALLSTWQQAICFHTGCFIKRPRCFSWWCLSSCWWCCWHGYISSLMPRFLSHSFPHQGRNHRSHCQFLTCSSISPWLELGLYPDGSSLSAGGRPHHGLLLAAAVPPSLESGILPSFSLGWQVL